MNETTRWLIMLAAAYLTGSISFALILGRIKGIDIRKHGSGNVGASNVGRTLGRSWGMICFTLDVLKGLVPVVVAGLWFGTMALDLQSESQPTLTSAQSWWWLGVGAASIGGHMFSVFLGFKGGKGVATGFGAMVGMYPHLTWPALGAMAVWLICVRLSRYISLSSIVASASLPLWYVVVQMPRDLDASSEAGSGLSAWGRGLADGWPFLAVTVLMAVFVAFKHTSNIKRLLNGTEPKIGQALPDEAQDPPTTPPK
ncbi:MAG: glycerol-3-phosphate 1-O-acyltransferase [Planctomycetes bacterium]|nr:glycerol-3-phosphate 1-O-acyltransferase [Planctomycetota bacterium]NOG54455.1 glycerol-3-phosphate 1-O-acyltransferase PlsY [Planctomycetota bacterium]